jgi:hypothetical protein
MLLQLLEQLRSLLLKQHLLPRLQLILSIRTPVHPMDLPIHLMTMKMKTGRLLVMNLLILADAKQ